MSTFAESDVEQAALNHVVRAGSWTDVPEQTLRRVGVTHVADVRAAFGAWWAFRAVKTLSIRRRLVGLCQLLQQKEREP